MRVRLVFIAAAALLALTGCPREPDAPEPGMDTPCEQIDDCNAGDTCGLLTLCVDGFCAEEPTLVLPCPGDGAPVRPPG